MLRRDRRGVFGKNGVSYSAFRRLLFSLQKLLRNLNGVCVGDDSRFPAKSDRICSHTQTTPVCIPNKMITE